MQKNFNFSNDAEGELKVTSQYTSNDKLLKLYKINSNLVDYNSGNLENSINYTYTNDNAFFGINTSIYETLSEVTMINMSIYFQKLLLIKIT